MLSSVDTEQSSIGTITAMPMNGSFLRYFVLMTLGMLELQFAQLGWAADDHIFYNGFDQVAGRGGSNYLWYQFTPNPDCNHEAYGVLKNYHWVRAQIQNQLLSMRAAGTNRISIGITYGHGSDASSGFVIDSFYGGVAGAIDPQYLINLDNWLADIKASGIDEILFRFFPQPPNNPSFGGYNPSMLVENMALIGNLRTHLIASALFYRIDLLVEGMPHDNGCIGNLCQANTSTWSKAVRAMWRQYRASYGVPSGSVPSDTVGFSFLTPKNISDSASSYVRQMSYVYEGNNPYLYAFDFYGPPLGNITEYQAFKAFDAAMKSKGFTNEGWIISESFYNDAIAAQGMAQAIQETGRTVFYLTQWQQRRDSTCVETVAPPLNFNNYIQYGF